MSKEVNKSKKKNLGRIKLFCFWIIIIVLIVVLLKIKANRTNGGSIIGMITNNGKSNSANAEAYVKEHYLNYKLLNDFIDGASKENKLKYVTDILNEENGSRLSEIETEKVAAKYKEIFAEDLNLGTDTIYLSNQYRHDDGKNFESLLIEDTEKEEVEEPENVERTEEVVGDTTHKLLITGVKDGNNKGEKIVSIKCCAMKSASEILAYAEANSKDFDIEKIKEISEKENPDSSDYKYLYDLVTDANLGKLTITEFTSKMTVKDNGNGTYKIVAYSVDN